MKKTAYIRSASAAAVIGLTLPLGGVTAVAQDDIPVPAAPSPVIDENAPVTLTIDKRLNPTSIGGPGSGATDPSATGNPLKGATFTGTLLDISGVDPKKLGDLKADNYTQLGAKETGTTVAGETGENGQLKFDSQNPQGSQFKQGI